MKRITQEELFDAIKILYKRVKLQEELIEKQQTLINILKDNITTKEKILDIIGGKRK